MRNLFIIAVACFVIPGISISANAQPHFNTTNFNDGSQAGKSPKFIEGIEIKAENVNNNSVTSVGSVAFPLNKNTDHPTEISTSIESISSLQFKYAQVIDCNVEELKNISLYNFINDWLDTRYHYGGTSKKGIDCSALTGLLMSTVFAVKIPRTARDQYKVSLKIDKEEMREGDLVFFNTIQGVSHVGVYLGNGFFVHASRNNGVIISNLNEDYYNNRFIGAGRVIGNEHVAMNP